MNSSSSDPGPASPSLSDSLSSAGFSVLILTHNDDRDLPLCLASVAGCDDVVVLDAGSKDQTIEIARAAGARVVVRPFDHLAGQRNHAQRQITFRHPWVFHLAADERLTPELRLECRGAAASGENVDGFLVAPKVYWDDTWLRHASGFPAPEPRFVRAPAFEFVNAGPVVRAAPHLRLGRLHTCYLHDPSRGGEDEWLARQRLHARAGAPRFPGGPGWRFFQRYVLQRGLLDGWAGLHYCRLLAQYERILREERRRTPKSGE